MNRIKILLLAVILTALTFSFPACAGSGQSAFDYSAEKMECTILPPAVDLEEAERVSSLLGRVTAADWAIGPEDALLTIIEYADFQCPYCAGASLQLLEYQKEHKDEVQLVFRHFPLSFHEKAVPAALAAEAAGFQGMFFEAEQFLFERQGEWSTLPDTESFNGWLKNEFREFSGLDYDLWLLAFSDSLNEVEIRKQYAKVISTGIVSGTPTVFLNYTDSNYQFDDASLDKLLERLKLDTKAVTECPDVVISESTLYTAVLETEARDIHIELFPEIAPKAVNSFIYLAGSGWFDGIRFGESDDGLLLNAENMANAGYIFERDSSEGMLPDGAGYIGIKNSAENASRFFITEDLPALFREKILQDCHDESISENTVSKYVEGKVLRFSEGNTIFGRIAAGDMDKLEHLENGGIIRSIRIL